MATRIRIRPLLPGTQCRSQPHSPPSWHTTRGDHAQEPHRRGQPHQPTNNPLRKPHRPTLSTDRNGSCLLVQHGTTRSNLESHGSPDQRFPDSQKLERTSHTLSGLSDDGHPCQLLYGARSSHTRSAPAHGTKACRLWPHHRQRTTHGGGPCVDARKAIATAPSRHLRGLTALGTL